MSTPVVRLSNVRVGRGKYPVLDDITLDVPAGCFLGIVGPNGAGKSTLLALVAGLIRPDAGTVNLFGQSLQPLNRHSLLKRVGFLRQLHGGDVPLPLRIRDVVAMGLTDYGAPLWRKPAHSGRVAHALHQVGMEAHMERDFRRLSGGEQQRVRLARALVRSPSLLLLDEPSAGLDAHGQARLYRLLRRLCDEESMAVIMVEHDIATITAHVDAVACLNVRIHHHAMKGESIPEHVWKSVYGEHMHIVLHDSHCIGCAAEDESP